MQAKVGISNRHVHLNKEDLAILFGDNYQLTKRNDLVQRGQYAASETVSIMSSSKQIDHVRILGPIRNYTQVEISKTDSYTLKLNPPYRDSGDLGDAEEITITGPIGEVTKKCCIIPVRHLHVNESDYTYQNKEIVKVKINNEKGGLLDNVYVKKDSTGVLELHLDTDDGNAFNLKNGDILEIIK